MARTEPLETLTSNPKEFIQRMKDSGERVILTVDGKAELVVQSADVDSNIVYDDDLEIDSETEAILLKSLESTDEDQCVEAGPVLQKLLDEQKARISS